MLNKKITFMGCPRFILDQGRQFWLFLAVLLSPFRRSILKQVTINPFHITRISALLFTVALLFELCSRNIIFKYSNQANVSPLHVIFRFILTSLLV
jgi:hypothetical protein